MASLVFTQAINRITIFLNYTYNQNNHPFLQTYSPINQAIQTTLLFNDNDDLLVLYILRRTIWYSTIKLFDMYLIIFYYNVIISMNLNVFILSIFFNDYFVYIDYKW